MYSHPLSRIYFSLRGTFPVPIQNRCDGFRDMVPYRAVLYSGRGTSQLCLTETKQVLTHLHIPFTMLTHIQDLDHAALEHDSVILGKFPHRIPRCILQGQVERCLLVIRVARSFIL